MIFNTCDVTLLSPINFRWKRHVARFQICRATLLGLSGKVASHAQIKETVFILSQVSEVVHGQEMRMTFSIVLGNFLVQKKNVKRNYL